MFVMKQGHWISENGWRMCNTAELDYSRVPGTTFALGVRKGSPSIILKALIWRLNQIEPMITSQIGCYTDTNAMSSSNHNSATAIDYNWNKHSYQVWGTWDYIKRQYDEVIASFGGIIESGEYWTSPKDAMHHELHFAEGHAGTEALARDLLNGKWGIYAPGGPNFQVKPAPVFVSGELGLGLTSDPRVRQLQIGLNKVFPRYRNTPLVVDGDYGPITAGAVTEFQVRALVNPVDGIVGPITAAALRRYGVVVTL